MSNNFTIEEIYPQILVYNNVFEDPQKMYNIIKEIDSEEEGIFENWKEWYVFGEKIESYGITFDQSVNEMKITEEREITNQKQIDQKYFITELIKGFHLVNNDYLKRFNFDMDLSSLSHPINPKSQSEADYFLTFPDPTPTWRWTGPSLCKYYENSGKDEVLSMAYHSDYIREPIRTPGYKFAITTTTYFNDDYEGGDVDFIIDNEIIAYKPKMGDFLVFPAGHPEILTKNGKVYLHGVKNNYKNEKFFTRLYWQKFDLGDPAWFENEEKYGSEEWLKMQPAIMEEYRETVATKNLDGLKRIK